MMNIQVIRRSIGFLLLVLSLGLLSLSAAAQKKGDTGEVDKARKQVSEATAVLSEMMQKPDSSIPRGLLNKAQAIAIFPGVVKGAFIVGGRGGSGVIVRRTPSGWSEPIFYNIGGASIGPQIGVNKTDYIMLFMNEGAVQNLMKSKLEFGGDVSFAAGPVGRTAEAGTSATLDAGILTWSHSKGAFIGTSIKGAAITPDNDRNQAVYGMKADQLLHQPGAKPKAGLPTELVQFTRTVGDYAGH